METAILHIVNNTLQTIGEDDPCLLIYLDFSSDLDTIEDLKLTNSLKTGMGFTCSVLHWFFNYLHN